MKPLFAVALLLAGLLLATPAAAVSFVSLSLCAGPELAMTYSGPRLGTVCSYFDDPFLKPSLQVWVGPFAPGEHVPMTIQGTQNGPPPFTFSTTVSLPQPGSLFPDGVALYLLPLYFGDGRPQLWTHETLVFALPTGDPVTVELTRHPVAPTPEPMTLLLFGTTAAGLGLDRWVKRRRQRTP